MKTSVTKKAMKNRKSLAAEVLASCPAEQLPALKVVVEAMLRGDDADDILNMQETTTIYDSYALIKYFLARE